MVQCPKCGNPKLVFGLQLDTLTGEVKTFVYTCPETGERFGCGWVGQFPLRMKTTEIVPAAPARKVQKITEAMQSLISSGDMILVLAFNGKELVW